MKNLILIHFCFLSLIISSFSTSCNSTTKQLDLVAQSTEQQSLSLKNGHAQTNNLIENVIGKYKLVEISGQFPPAGGTYSFDKIKNSWGMPPTGGEIMAYVTSENIDIEKVDLSQIATKLTQDFSKANTDLLNSCYISTNTESGKLKLSLYYKNAIAYQCETAQLKNNNSTENKICDVALIKQFDLAAINEGSMDLAAGKNYSFSGKNKTIILSFENDMGNYTLLFEAQE